MILADDIGGTYTRFGCVKRKPDGGWGVHHFKKIKGSGFATFDEALAAYIDELDVIPRRTAFAAAGSVKDGRVNLTNTDWQISIQTIQDNYNFEACGLYNDFAGMTRSVSELSDDDFTVLRAGQPRVNEPILVAGPGTGFGVGYLVPTRTGPHVLSTEGGHISYSPQTHLEFELLQILLRDWEVVSLELVSSGKGLPIIHKAACDIHGAPYVYLEPDDIRERAMADDPIYRDVCNIRACATMDAIGDLALAGGTRGGVVLAGGVSECMIDFFMQPSAMNRFLNRSPRSDYVRDIPLRLLKCPFAPLIGSAALLEVQS